jgi:LEA14-like dessication related protein
MALSKTAKYGIWAGVVALIGFSAIKIKKLVTQLQDFELIFKKVKVNKFNTKTLDFNVFYDYVNKSALTIKLSSQEYDIYVNGVFVTTMKNYAENVLKANETSPLGFNVSINLPELDQKIRASYYNMILDPKSVKLTFDMKFKARFGFINIPYRYKWDTNLKQILGWYLPVYRK